MTMVVFSQTLNCLAMVGATWALAVLTGAGEPRVRLELSSLMRNC